MMEEQDFTLNGINYKLINTDKYKTINGIIAFSRPLEKEDFTYYTLINRLIGASSNTYKTKKALSNKMFELYDCSCYLYTIYSYKTATSFFVFNTINGKIIHDDNLLKECINLLKDIMYNPNVDKLGFNEHNFLEEKKSLENDIKNVYNNKNKYAYRKMLEAMDPEDIISTSTLGDLNILNNITRKSLLEFYEKVLTDSNVSVGIIGDITKEEVIENFKDFNLTSKDFKFELAPTNIKYKENVKEVEEKQTIVQAKLYMGFRFDIDVKSKYYAPLIIFNAMFGSMFGSTLFSIIREKHSLTYDIFSEVILTKKILLVSCGLDPKNIPLTKSIVMEELKKYQEGNIDSKLMQVAKDFLVNKLKEMQDSAFGYLSFKLTSMIINRESIQEIIDKINSTTISEIKEVSNMIIPDVVYTLVLGEKDE